MFSYISTHKSQSTFQANLISEIYSLGNEIFDNQMTSVSRTDQQELSLELSPATSEDNLQNKQRSIHQQQQDIIKISDVKRHVQKIQKQHGHSTAGITKTYYQSKQLKNQNRMTRSAIVNTKEQGAFSNKYVVKNPNVNRPNHQYQQQQKTQENIKQQLVLNNSNLNKSNILMGILNQNQSKKANRQQKSQNKSPYKMKAFSNFAQTYLSPYSTKGIKENPKSYMEKSHSKTKKQKETTQFQYIKKRINQNIQPQISYRKQKINQDRQKNQKLSNIKSKYKQNKPLLHQYRMYAQEHIYKKQRQQMRILQQKTKIYQTRSPEQAQVAWQEFIQKQKRFVQTKKQSLLDKQLQKMQSQTSQFITSPTKNIIFNLSRSQVTPPKLTPQDFVNKYKRQKEKLKEKLESHEISNYLQRSFKDQKRFGRQIFDSIWGSSLSNHQQSLGVIAEDYSTIKQNQNNHQISHNEVFNLNDQGNKLQNFFVSMESENKQPNSFKKKGKGIKLSNYQSNSLTRSSIFQSSHLKPQRYASKSAKSKSKSRSRSKNNNDFSTSGRKSVVRVQNPLFPFIKQMPFFSSLPDKPLFPPTQFNPKKHNSPLFNESIKKGDKQKSVSRAPKQQLGSHSVQTSQLLNPKYFKSINELQQYASNNSKNAQLPKKTFDEQYQSKVKRGGNNLIKIQNNQFLSQNVFKNIIQPYATHQARKNVITGLDQNLMRKTIEDIQRMRIQIQQNKKRRKYRIQNYRNFSNIRPGEQTFKQFRQKSLQARQNQKYMNRFKNNERSKSPFQQQRVNRGRSRSVSPIQQQDSISTHSNNLSVSMIQPSQQHSYINDFNKNSQISQFSSRMANSNMILVKSKQQIEFVLSDFIKEQKRQKGKNLSKQKYTTKQ